MTQDEEIAMLKAQAERIENSMVGIHFLPSSAKRLKRIIDCLTVIGPEWMLDK
jgi:hypothetical protein